jgi:hypothetical protein
VSRPPRWQVSEFLSERLGQRRALEHELVLASWGCQRQDQPWRRHRLAALGITEDREPTATFGEAIDVERVSANETG